MLHFDNTVRDPDFLHSELDSRLRGDDDAQGFTKHGRRHSGGIIVLLCVLVLPARPAVAVEPTPADDTVRQLIEALNAPQFEQRTLAERQLREMGPGILPVLDEIAADTSPRVKDALLRVRNHLERMRTEELTRPSQVTITGRFTLQELVAAIDQQTGNPLTLNDAVPSHKTRDVNLQKQTFWQALTWLQQEYRLALHRNPEERRLHLTPAPPASEGPLVIIPTGAFRVQITSAVTRPDFTDRSRQIIRVQMCVEIEPRQRGLFVHVVDRDFTARTKDDVLAPLNSQGQRELPATPSGFVTFPVDFVLRATQQLSQIDLSGMFDVELAVSQEEFVFRPPWDQEHERQHRAGVGVELNAVEFEPGADGQPAVRVVVTVLYDDAQMDFASHRSWVLHHPALLEDTVHQRQWRPAQSAILAQRPSGVVLEYRFEDVPSLTDLDRLTLEVPSRFSRVSATFTAPVVPVSSGAGREGQSP